MLMTRIANKLNRTVKRIERRSLARRLGVVEHKNYSNSFIVLERFRPGAVAIDVGCAQDADFSHVMIEKYGCTAYAVDPTRQHADELRSHEAKLPGKFHYCPYAVGQVDGVVTFHHDPRNQSGSLIDEHISVQDKAVQSYDVECLSLASLLDRLGLDEVDILKLDIEGAEYGLLLDADLSVLSRFKQIFIEFHHHAVPQFTMQHTQMIVDAIKAEGFSAFSFDDHNYLFYR